MLTIFVAGWLFNVVFDVNSVLGIADDWLSHGWLEPWYDLIVP